MPDKEAPALMGIDFANYPQADYSLGINPHTFNEAAA